jgi:hypothetical protein
MTFSSSSDAFKFELSSRVVAEANAEKPRNSLYREPQLKHVCNHYLSGIQYTLNTCRRCLGTGYYFDIKFDAGGLVPQVWDETKLIQELEKITLTNSNPFHPDYGINLQQRIGQANTDELKSVIQRDLLTTVYTYIKYQKEEASKSIQNGYFSSYELIDSINKIEITELSPTELVFTIYIITIHGKEIQLTGKILV